MNFDCFAPPESRSVKEEVGMKATLNRSLFFVGLTLIFAGGGVYFLVRFPQSFQSSVAHVTKTLPIEDHIGTPGPTEWGTIQAAFEIKIESLPNINTGDSTVLILSAKLGNPTFVPVARRLPQPGAGAGVLDLQPPEDGAAFPPGGSAPVPPMTDEQLLGIVRQRIQRGDIAFSLALAGADVEPVGRNPISENGQARWSIHPKAEGTLHGFIKPEFLRSEGGHAGQYRMEYSTEEYIPVSLTTREPLITQKNIVSGAVGFFGTLLTLPGILEFLRRRRESSQKTEAELAKESPKIIRP
jgi:hypothetical protein